MNNSLDQNHTIDRSLLNEEFYVQSLLEAAQHKALLSESDITNMQHELLSLLAEKTAQFRGGESSSIRVEKAQEIMSSLLFTVGIWLKTYPAPEDAVTALQQESIRFLYQKGRRRIDTMLAATKTTYAKLQDQLLDTPNLCYRETLADGIPGFFKLYRPDYFAQEVHITADYPLLNPMPKLAGIEFISAYVKAAYFENQFCTCFSADVVHRLLRGYQNEYPELIFNLYEIIYTAAIGCVLTGTDLSQLDITQAGLRFLVSKFQSENGTIALLSYAVAELICRFQFSQELSQYLKNSIPHIKSSIKIAVQNQTLHQIFILPTLADESPKIPYSLGEKMDDGQYRKVVEEIRACRFCTDKLALMKTHIHTLSDLEDVLLDAAFSREEMQFILQSLEPSEIIILSKRHLLQFDSGSLHLRAEEQFLSLCLQDFISTLPASLQAQIKIAGKMIVEE